MRMLTRDGSSQYLLELKERLEENGIPSFIQGEETARMIYRLFPLWPSLWIYIDDQFDDAVKLIHNPDHVVETEVDVEQFYELQPSEQDQRKALNRVLVQVVLFLVGLMGGVFMLIRFLESVN